MRRIAGVMVGLIVCAGLLLGAADVAQAGHTTPPYGGCFNCHVPHQANPVSATDYGVPLWSPKYATVMHVYYTMYSSPTFDALSPEVSAQPDGASKLCLGCHDGSYVKTGGWSPRRVFGSSSSLSTTHPISFKYTSAMAGLRPRSLRDPALAPANVAPGGSVKDVLLDSQGKMQCTSCHDVHTSGFGEYMLRWDGILGDPLSGKLLADGTTNAFVKGSELPMCNTCHKM